MFILYFYRSYKDYLEALFLWEGLYFYMCMVNTYSKGKDQPGKVINPAHGQLNNRENYFSLSSFAPENLVSRDAGSGSPVPRQPAHPHTQAESGAFGIPPVLRGGVHLFIYTTIRHRVSSEFVGSRNYVPVAFTAESPPAQGQ